MRSETIVKSRLGATYLGNGRCQFLVWAPNAQSVEVRLLGAEAQTDHPMEPFERGYYFVVLHGVKPGALYSYRLNGKKVLPDPASRFQPNGVHGPSQITNPDYDWTDQSWAGLSLQDYILYELHVGTFTRASTFDAIIPHLDELQALGVTAIELMPVAQFPGTRNWGYDGVHPFSVQNSYGGPPGLRRFVEACHQRRLATVLDVVYNHLGPEGNYLAEFGPYFTRKFQTAWGEAINFDGPHSDEVRRFFIENALYWITEFHIDALRLDAVHAIFDQTAYPFLQELGDAVHRQANELRRPIYVIAESSLNDTRLVQTEEVGGYSLDAQWNDDFHHSLHTLLTRERAGYYADFGRLDDLRKALAEGYVYTGQYSHYRQRRHGKGLRQVPSHKFVVAAQTHDQVGNRRLSERLSQLVSFEGLKLAAGAVLLSPYVPLLFMGEEYGETAPFLYFISHGDPELAKAVHRGRSREFAAFAWQGEIPDPQAEETFERSKLDHKLRQTEKHRTLLDFYAELIRIRRTTPALAFLSKEHLQATTLENENVLCLRRWTESEQAFCIFHFGDMERSAGIPFPEARWHKILDSSEARWLSSGSSLPTELNAVGDVVLTLSPQALAVYRTIGERKPDKGAVTQ
jgi:maltooligosyltrehalose trehalohydrolase